MELLINAIMQQGGDRRRLVAKVFGAANVLPALQSPTVGELNATFVRDFLATERIALVAQRLGGTHAVQVHFRTDTGKTIVHSVNGSRLPAILSAEDAYRCDSAEESRGYSSILKLTRVYRVLIVAGSLLCPHANVLSSNPSWR